MSQISVPAKSTRYFSWVDIALLSGICLVIYALVGVAATWTGPYASTVEINLSLLALPKYAFFSLTRGVVAYIFSLIFTLIYGYVAAHSRVAERILVPLLDILQSIPVLGFLPGLVIALVHLFPGTNIGLELACILMIFTGQVWNMTFSFYASVSSVPKDWRNVGEQFGLSRWEVLKKLEIPYSMTGLVWNSMLSMAGGWFFLMVVESFSLGEQRFRVPGIGSYMAVAIEERNTFAIVAGLSVMFFIIILVDRFVWAPLVSWSHRFKPSLDHVEEPDPIVTRWLRRSHIVRNAYEFFEKQSTRRARRRAKRLAKEALTPKPPRKYLEIFFGVIFAVLAVATLVALFSGAKNLWEILHLTRSVSWLHHLRDTFYTCLRVVAAVTLGSLWTVPVGVWIGTHPEWTRRLQPVVQILASFPAPMVFPVVTLFLIYLGVSFEIGAIVLMLLGSQWYILFNAIAGSTLIPKELDNVAKIYSVRGLSYWKTVILPTIFPSLLNGWITAAGGAWNASIVSEAVSVGSTQLFATGIGASITQAAGRGDFASLAGGITTMVVVLVLINRFFWRRLYQLAETKYNMTM